jgi:two-component system chemotaxis response regulator CheY
MRSSLILVEDDDAVRTAILEALTDEGYHVSAFADGAGGLAFLQKNPATPLVLLDWNMVPMNGAAFMREMAKQPALSRIPVIVVTADLRVEEEASVAGASAFLRKPVHLERLLEVVKQHVSL